MIPKSLRSGFLAGIGFFSAAIVSFVVFATYTGLTASSGEQLTIGKWNELLQYTVPPGTIIAYSGATCPSNWSEYTAARGRFLRGIDNGAGNDPDGTRAIGAAQADAFQGHHHSLTFSVDSTGLPNVYPYMSNGYSSTAENATSDGPSDPVTDGRNGTPRTASETRPKNVAVLFCIKN